MLIFDIGANRGLFTEKCLELYPDSRIVTVEANQLLAMYLTDKYSDNNRVNVVGCALSDRDGSIIFYINPQADTISTSSKNWIDNSRFKGAYSQMYEVEVECKTLDSLISNYGAPDLLKIDVEGSEYEVVRGLTKKVGPICFEWAEEEWDNIQKTVTYLEKLGYGEFGYILGDEYLKEPDIYSGWKNCEIHNNVNADRKELWGMIWAK